MLNENGATSNQRLENQLTELTSLVRQLSISQHQPIMAAKVCGICTFIEHPTDTCPTLQESESDQPEHVGAVGGFQYGRQPYQPRLTDNQQYGIQTFRPGPQQGPICAECALGISRLPTVGPIISGTTFPTTTTVESAYSRQFSISGRSNEAACNQQPGVPTIRELQQYAILAEHDRHHPRPQNVDWTASQYCEPITVGRIEQPTLSNNSKSERKCQCGHPEKQKRTTSTCTAAITKSRPEPTVPLPFPSQTVSARKPESDEELLKMFRKVEINIPLLDAINQVPKYAKFLKELCIHKRRKIKGSREIGGMVSALTKNEELTIGATRALPRKCRDPGIFSVLCTIGDCTFADTMLDFGVSINVMLASIYRSLNFGDLEPTGMTIQLENRSIVQPLGVLEDVLVQVNELIFPTDLYVLDMKDEASGMESTLILGSSFLMTARTKIDVHARMLSIKIGDTLVQFNIFEAMKHPTEDHSLFGIDLLDEIIEEYFQLKGNSEDIENFARSTDEISCLGFTNEEADYKEVQDLPHSEDNHSDIADLDFESSRPKQPKAEIMLAHLVSSLNQVSQTDPNLLTKKSSLPSPPMELKPLLIHLKYAYLDKEQQLQVIIANNLHQEHKDKLFEVLRQHKKAIGWKLSDLPA
ncbi:hypothetical protein CR513_20750, partial [Mucuna pruriens]